MGEHFDWGCIIIPILLLSLCFLLAVVCLFKLAFPSQWGQLVEFVTYLDSEWGNVIRLAALVFIFLFGFVMFKSRR